MELSPLRLAAAAGVAALIGLGGVSIAAAQEDPTSTTEAPATTDDTTADNGTVDDGTTDDGTSDDGTSDDSTSNDDCPHDAAQTEDSTASSS